MDITTLVAVAEAGPNNLPVPSTSFIGREGQIDEVTRLLAAARLLTLTCAGGCGKTRLALRVGMDVLPVYPDGVWLVELAALADPALVAQAAARAVNVKKAPGRPVIDSLIDHLRAKTSLLILDNCEHVIEAAARVAEALLRACPGLRILATSREPLRTAGEVTWLVPSLSLPPRSRLVASDLDRMMGSEAVRLFADRAQAARPGFALSPADGPALQEICLRLDGIPLAIELAAARVRVFSLDQIAARLDDRFRLLTAGPRTVLPRQQTLRATVDWSYALLAEPERSLLRRLSVFAGGWTIEAAETVAAGDDIEAHAVIELLAALVEKSLVLAEHRDSATRYRLPETIREYARERLQESGAARATLDRHVAYFLGLAEATEPRLRGPHVRLALDRLEEEHDNLRLAIERALETGGEQALRLCGALGWFWWNRSYHTEGRRWLERALATNPDPTAARMKALHAAAWLAHHQRDLNQARAWLTESLTIARALDDRWTVAWVLHVLGRVAYFENDPATARSLGEESLAVAEGVGDSWLIAWSLHVLGLAAYLAGDDATARTHYERSLAIRRPLGFQEGIAVVLALLGLVALREGNLTEAQGLFREGLAIWRTLAGAWGSAMILAGLSRTAAALGQPLRAVRLGAAAAVLAESYRTPLIPLFEPVLREGLEVARRSLRQDAFARAWAEGRALPLDQAVAEALASQGTPGAAPGGRDGPFGSFTVMERRVLRLLASGRTTREIAGELVIAVSTVDRHITHIYGKLGVRNRAEATRLALEHGLV